jgi:hypothetical protein
MPIYANQDFSNARLKTFKEEEETGVLNEFGKGFGAGVDQLQALAGGAKALVGSAVGNDDWFYDGMEYFDEQMAEAAENTADVGRLEDIDGVGDLANYSAFIVGNIIPSLIGGGGVGAVGGAVAKKVAINQGAKALVKKNAEGMAKSAASRQYAQSAVGREALGKVGLKGQVAGAVGFGTVMGAGESFTRIFDETGEEAAGLALVTGLASGALDAMTPMRVLKRVLPQNLYGKATQEIAENVSKKQSVIGRAFKEAAKASGTEGVTEMMQEVVQNSTLEFVRGQQDPAIEEAFLERLFDEENKSQYLNAFVAGAIGGGAIGGVTGAVTKDPEAKQNLDEDALKGEPEDSSPEAAPDEEQGVDDKPQPEATDAGGAKVQAARAKGLGLPTARTTIAPKTLEEVRAELDGLPEQREASDPEARQAEARAKARAQIDGLPAVREKVKEIYQMELGTLGETTRIPKDKEPVAEEAPVFGGNLPESITPRMEELVGQDVDYNGNKGPVIKKDDGFYVATQDNGDVLIESGEYQSPEQLGVVPTGGNLVFEKDVQIDDNNKFELRGKKYSLTRIVRDADGEPLSLAVRDENGAKKTIRTPEVVARINNQKNPAPDFSQIIVELDDLPASIQKQVIQQSDADNIPDSVPASQAIEIAQSMPNAESVVEGIQELATQSLTIPQGSMSNMPAVPYTESVTRPNMKPLAKAIAEINESQGANRSPIDQSRLDGLFDAPEVTMQNGNTVTVAEGVQAEEIKHALVDLLGAGLPKRVMNYVGGFYAHTDSQMNRQVDGSYLRSAKVITLNSARIKELIADKENNGDSAVKLRFVIAHEIGHAFDVGTSHTTNSPDFSLEMDGLGMNSATYEMGPVIHELGQNYLSGTELGQELAYPFGPAFEWIANSEPQNIASQVDRIQKEAFAQAFAIFHTSPELLQEQAPKTYKHLEALLRTQPTETIQNGEADIRTNEADGQSQEVQGDVRSPTQRGSTQVQEQQGAGGDGGGSADAEQASQGLGEQTEPEVGDGAGRALQLEEESAEARLVEQELGAIDDDYDPMDDLAGFDDDALYSPSSIERLQEVDPSYNQAKVRSLSQLQERIPLAERISGRYVEGQPLTPVSGGEFSDLDLSNRGDGLDISQTELDSILAKAISLTDTNAEGQVGDLAQQTVERLGINANTVEFWDRALKLSDNARYWYEVSAEAMRDVMPDLSPNEIRQFISVVAATSPVANPFVNMHRAMASFANHLQGKAIDNDLVIQKGVTDALKTADLEGLKTGSFGGTMQLVLGMAKPTLSTNDRQVAATFNTDGEAIGKNPELYEVMSRFYMGLRDKLNANLPEGAQPYETWQLQALGWVEQRYKNEFVKDKQADGMSEKAALAAYQSASPEDISGGVNDVDDYSMSLLREDSSGRRDRKGAIQILKEAGIAVPDDKITREILLDPRVPAALSPTTANFREKRTITAEINSLRNDIGKDARSIFDAAVQQGNQKIADEYHAVFATLLNKSSQGASNPFTAYFKALGLPKADAKPTRVSTPTGGIPLAVGGTYEGDVSPNVRVPVPPSITGDQLNVIMTSLSKQWDQDAVPASHVVDMADGLREGYTETSQVFVETLDALSRDQIEAFASALPEGVEVNFTRYPNGYEFNVLAFDQETFDPVTPDMNEVATAAEAMQDQTGGSITNLHVKDAQWQPAGYSEIGNYDDVFASFKKSLYNEQAQKLIGKIQRKQNGKVRDLTEKQIVAELKRKNKSEDFAGQGNARIQRAHGAIKQRLSDFKQAEGIAKGLAEARDTKLKLFIQKNSKTLRVSPQVDDQLDAPPRNPSDFVTAPTSTAAEIMSDEDLVASVRAGTTSGGESGIPSSGIKKWLQKNFSSRGLLPETAFDSMIQRDGEFGAVELDIRQMVGIYDNAVVENFGKIDGQQREVLDDAMKRPASEIEATSLPRDIKDSLIAMRGYIDSLSAQYAQVLNDDINTLKAQGDEQALAKSELLGIVVNNMGTYANRSYQAFNNKDWNKEVPDEVVLAARNFLVEQGTANPDQVVNTILKEGTAYDDMASFISESKLGAKDLAILTQRKQIAPEIRALLGEYKDPRVNFANSASKMSRLIYNDRFLKEVLESGNGVFLFDQESAPADATKKIAEVGSKTLSPLNGMYTYPEVEQAFKDALGKEEMGDLYRTIIKVNGLVKYGKTVIAPTTMFRNFMSASMFTVANGHFNWSKLSKSTEVAGSYFSGIGDGVEYLKNLKKLGVVHDSPYAGEMIAYLQDANAQGMLDQRDPSAILDVKDSALTAGKSTAQFFTKAYQFGDDFWKIVGFENEVMSFMENKGVSREEAEPLAAKRIRDTYPTYSLIGKIPQMLRRFPLVGTFVSFPAEIVRTQANMIKYLREDLADPDMRPAALKRITGMAMMSAGVYAAQAMAMSAFGVSEEEEEAIKLMAAPWAKNSNILVTGRDDEGRLEYLDLTHLDPYALMKRPLNALMRDQPIDDALIDASAEILKPFLGWDISTNTILEFISNEKSSGGQVYNEADTFINQVGDTYLHFERGMGPSVAQNVRRMSRAMGGEISKSGKAYDVGDEMAAFVGFRKTTFDPKTALHFKAYEFSEGKRQSTRLLTSVFRDPNDVSDSDIREAFGRASTARRETFEDMAALVSASMSSGLTPTQAMTILRSNGVTKKDAKALIQGGASAWTMSDSTLKNSVAKSDVLFGKQKSEEFKDRWTLIQQLLNEES